MSDLNAQKMQLGKKGDEITRRLIAMIFIETLNLKGVRHLADTSLRRFSMVQAPVCGAEP